MGVARKIGMDYCLQFATGNSLLFSLDADTLISKSYLQLITKYYHSSNFNTCIVKFLHQKSSNQKIEKAIRLYENILYDIFIKLNNVILLTDMLVWGLQLYVKLKHILL